MTADTKTYRFGNSEVSRLPKDVAFDEVVESAITRSGDALTVFPTDASIQAMLAKLAALPKLDAIEIRDAGELPERGRG